MLIINFIILFSDLTRVALYDEHAELQHLSSASVSNRQS